VHGVVRWRLVDLCQWVFEAFKVAVSTQTMSRELRAMDYRKLSARPRHHAQAAGAIEDFKKVSHRERGKGVDPGAIEIWFADEARIGQKNKITRPWAKRGTRPSAPSDQRTASTYIFGAICPREGKAVGLILPKCNTEAMQLHLDDRQGRRAEAPGHPASRSGGMAYVPQARRPGQSHPPAPASPCPEFNPVETIWQFLRDNWLSNRRGRRVRLSGTPWLGSEFVQASQQWSSIMSIGLRQWANRS
jgi:hypothetical protein